MLIVDTNVVIDILVDDPQWGTWSAGKLRALAQVHELLINPVIYTELSFAFSTPEALDREIAGLELVVADIPRSALFLAGKAFLHYRRRGGTKSNVLADFFVGAHAAVLPCPVLTRDPRRYRSYFGSLDLITPAEEGA